MWWGWWAWGIRDLTAAFQNARRIAPTRQLAHGVAERASREQQRLQQRGTRGSDVSISPAELDVLVISRDEGAKTDYDDEDGGYSLMMKLFLCDGYTCSIVVSRFVVGGLGGEALDSRQFII